MIRTRHALQYARTDFRMFLGRRVLLGTAVLVLGIELLPAVLYVQGLRDGELTFGQYLVASTNTLVLPLALAGVVLGYEAIAAHRERNSVRLLLGAPYTRSELFVGAYLSRLTGAAAIALLAVTAAVALALPAVPLDVGTVAVALSVTVLTVTYAALWAGVAVSVSTLVSTRRRAVLALLGVIGGTIVLWPLVQFLTGILSESLSSTLRFARPVDGYWALLSVAAGVETATAGDGASVRQTIAAFAFGVVWLVAPPWYAVRRFARTDL